MQAARYAAFPGFRPARTAVRQHSCGVGDGLFAEQLRSDTVRSGVAQVRETALGRGFRARARP